MGERVAFARILHWARTTFNSWYFVAWRRPIASRFGDFVSTKWKEREKTGEIIGPRRPDRERVVTKNSKHRQHNIPGRGQTTTSAFVCGGSVRNYMSWKGMIPGDLLGAIYSGCCPSSSLIKSMGCRKICFQFWWHLCTNLGTESTTTWYIWAASFCFII